MLARPGMVGRALDREIERDLQSQAPGGQHEMIEIVETAERRLDRGMAASLAANRPRAAGTIGQRGQRVVGPLAMRMANRMYRRKINDVEAEVADCGQPAFGLPQRRGAPRDVSLRAREHLVPGAAARQWPVRHHLKQRLILGGAKALAQPRHQAEQLLIRNNRDRIARLAKCAQALERRVNRRAVCVLGATPGGLDEGDSLEQVGGNIAPRFGLFPEAALPRSEEIGPRLDREEVAVVAIEREFSPPAIVVHVHHR